MIPAEYRPPQGPEAWQQTQFQNVMRPTFGSLGSLFAEFRVEHIYSGKRSAEAGEEVRMPVEIVCIRADKYSSVPKRLANKELGIRSELSPKEEIDTAQLYERFKTQKDSTDTQIMAWEAATDNEKMLLGQVGVWTVEQLHSLPEEQRYRLGPNYRDIWERADRFMSTKKKNDKDELAHELTLLRQEREQMAERLARLEELHYQQQAQIADAEREDEPRRRPGRPRKPENEEQTNA